MIARVREAVFNILADRVLEARVGDFFSGTGAIGLEALSRGASHVDFFECGRSALSALQANIASLDVAPQTRIHRVPLPHAIQPGEGWDIVFVDPPWGKEKAPPVVDAILAADRLAEEGWIVMEERYGLEGSDEFWQMKGLEVRDRRRYGDSGVLMMVKG
jgi:16S rRNA (guanine966-N2)-methyltransferase